MSVCEQNSKDMNREMVKIRFKEEQECIICLCQMKHKSVKFMRCGHVYHMTCINKWLKVKGNCPTCRLQIIETKENEIGDVRQNLLQIIESLDIDSIFPFLLTDIQANEPDEISEID